MAKTGYPATTVTGICRRAGVSPNAFYDHFASKEECYLAAYDAFVEGIVEAMAAAASGAATWESFVNDALGAYLELLDAEGEASRAFVLQVDTAGEAARAHLRRTLQGFADLLATRHASMVAQGSSRAVLPGCAYLGVVHGLRAVVGQALVDGHPTRLVDLLADLSVWIQATVCGSGRSME